MAKFYFNPVCKTYFNRILFTAAVLLSLASFNFLNAQSNVGTGSQITLTGNATDFTNAGYTGYADQQGTGCTYYIGYDNANVYIGMFRSSTFGSSDNLTIYLDTDPNATPTGGTGTTSGQSYNSVTGTLPFTANYNVHVEQGYQEARSFGSGWASTISGVTYSVGNSWREVKIPYTSIGSPVSLYVTCWMGYSGGIYASAPGAAVAASGNPTIVNYWGGFGVTSSGCNPTSTVSTAITDRLVNGVPASAARYGWVSATSGSNTAAGNFTIAPGGSINVAGGTLVTGSNTITMSAGSTVTQSSGTLTATGSTFNFSGAGYVNGGSAITFNNVTINTGALTLTTVPTINGNLQINGGNVSAAPNYGSSSTLIYNVSTYTAFNEWTGNATSGAGVPQNVQVGNGTNSAINFGSSANYYQLNGNLSIAASSSLTLSSNASSAGLKFGGNFSNSGTYTDNGRGTWYVGTGTGSLYSLSALGFNYLIHGGTGTLQLNTSTAAISINGNTSALQFLSSGGLDLNQKTLTLNTNATVLLNAAGAKTISSTGGTGTLAFAGTNTITPTSGSLVTNANVAVTVSNAGLTIGGASALTVQGSLQLNASAFIASGNAPVYGSASTLIYNSGASYGPFTEWTTGATTGAGVPANVQVGNGVANSGITFANAAYTMTGSLTFSNNTGAAVIMNAGGGTLNIGGSWVNNTTNAANFTRGGGTVVLNGGAAQTIGGSNINAGGYAFNSLTINNTVGGVSLSKPITVAGTLTLTSGVVTTTTTNTLSVTNTATGAVSGGSSTAYISGPLNRSLPASLTSNAGVYSFPVGDAINGGGAYLPFSITTLTTGATGPVLQVQATNTASGGTAGSGLATIGSEFWNASVVSGNFTNGSVSLTKASIGSNNAIGQSATQGGAYASIGGTLSGNSVNNSSLIGATPGFFVLGALPGPIVSSVTSNNSVNNSGYAGSTITINGTNLQVTAASDVTFGGVAATAISTNTPTQLVVTLGAGASGLVSITNTSSQNGTYAGFTYLGYITNAAADYNTGSTWLNGSVPPAGSTVTINNNGVTVSGASNAPTNLYIRSGAALNIQNGGSLTATTVVDTGTLGFTTATGTFTATTLTVLSGANVTWTANGTLNATTLTNAGTVNMTGGGTLNATTITNNGTFTGGAGTVNMAATGTFTNNSTFTGGTSLLNYAGAGTLNGTTAVTLNNLTINTGALTLTTVPTINGTFTINNGNVSAAPRYGGASTLYYNTSYGRFNEWNATGVGTIGTTAGYPFNVTINTGTFDVYNSASGVARALGGTLTVNTGATMNFNAMNAAFTVGANIVVNGGTLNMNTMSGAVAVAGNVTINTSSTLNMGSMSNAITVAGSVSNSGTLTQSGVTGGDINVAQNWTRASAATYTPNGRAVFFNGSSNQTITVTGGGTEVFHYLILNNTGANVILAGSPNATNVTVNGSAGGTALQLVNGTLDLNGQTFSLNTYFNGNQNGIGIDGTGGNLTRTVTSSTGTGTFAITHADNTSRTATVSRLSGNASLLSFTSSATVTIGGTGTGASGIDFGNGLSTINGIFQVNARGFVGNNPPTYANNSTLIYNSGTTYNVGNEWSNGISSGAGVPYNVQIGNTVSSSAISFSGLAYTVRNNVTFANVSGAALTLTSGSSELNIGGNWINNTSNVANFTHGGGKVTFNNATSAQSIGGSNINTGGYAFGQLTINNGSSYLIGVTLTKPITVANTLTMTTGVLNTDATNTLTITNTANTGTSGGSQSPLSYVNGPLTWNIASNPGTNYNFPVGANGTYLPFTLNSPAGTLPVVTVTAVTGAPSGTADGTTVTALSTSQYWTATYTGTYTGGTLSLGQQSSLSPYNVIARSTSNSGGGTFASLGGTVSGNSVINSSTTGSTLGSFTFATVVANPTITNVGAATLVNTQTTNDNTGYFGQVINITGTGFPSNIAASDVTFNGTAAFSVTWNSATSISAVLNIGTTSGTIVVTNPNTLGTGTFPGFSVLGYISRATTDWNTNTTWMGGNLGGFTSAVPAANSVVTVVHNVGISAAVTAAPNSLTVTSAGTLTFTGGTITVNNTLTNAGAIVMTGGGTLTMASGSTLANGSATFTGGTGTVAFAGTGAVTGTITFANVTIAGGVNFGASSTVGTSLTINAGGFINTNAPSYGGSSTLIYNTGGTTYGRGLEWSATSGAGYPNNVQIVSGASLNVGNGALTTARQIAGNLQVDGGLYMDFLTDDMTAAVTVKGNLTIGTAGILSLSDASGGDLRLEGNWVRNTGGIFNPKGRAVYFAGTNAQTLTGQTTFDYVTMAKGSNNLTLNNNMIVNLTLTFTSGGTGGKIVTGVNTVVMGASGSTSNASNTSYIYGNQQYPIGTGSTTRTFDIGDATVLTGVTTAYTGVSTGGTLTVFTTAGDHPQTAAGSGLVAGNTANRYWTLTNSGIVGGTYTGTFYYATSDLDGGATPLTYVVKRYAASNWNGTTTGTATSNSAQAVGLNAGTEYGEFQTGNPNSLTVTTQPSASSICSGANTSFTAASTSTPAPTVKWQRDAGGGFADITGVMDGSVYTNYTTGTLNITGATTGMSGYQYRAVFTNVNGSVNSNAVALTVTLLVPSVTIAANPGTTICAGTSVTFTATPTNGGTPSYVWKKNGGTVGTNSPTYTDAALANNDMINVVMTSTATCASPTTATSNTDTMIVNPLLSASVSLGATPSGAVCVGTSVTFLASPTNGGATPNYTFRVNGVSQQSGTSNAYTTSSLANGDTVRVQMTSNAVCPNPSVSTSFVVMTINATPTVYTVTGGGNYCSGGSGVAVGLSNSQTGVNYQLKDGTTDIGSPVAGTTGSPITFGNQTLGTTFTVVATNPTTTCISNMSGNAVVYINPVPATPGLSPSANPVCSGAPVTFTSSGGAQYQFFVDGVSQGSPSATNTFTSSSLTNGQQVTVTSHTPFTFDGNITESEWGTPLATSTGGPAVPGFGAGHEINAFYALSDGNNINMAIAGNVSWGGSGNRILVFIDSKTGGYNNTNFGRTSAPGGISNINSGTTFDAGFNADYCLVIGTNNTNSNNFFDLYTLSGTAGGGGGSDIYLGDRTNFFGGAVTGSNPANASQTRGYEVAIPKTLLGYTSGTIKVFAIYISDAGFLSNQFLTRAGAAQGNFGNGAITFGSETPDPLTIPSLNLTNNCSATSTPVTINVTSSVAPSVAISTPFTTVCTGTNVTFTAVPTNGGGTPAYQWTKNGANVGTNSTTYSDNALANGDTIVAIITSSATCAVPSTERSNKITMTITSSVTPLVSIAASPSGAVCAGTNVTFTATPTFGGTTPSYQWTKNSVNVGTNSTTYSNSALVNGDTIAVVMTSNAACASPTTAASNNIVMTINPLPTAQSVGGGGAYCSGGSGAVVTLSSSESGVNYQLKRGVTNVGSPVAGSGSSISFPAQTTAGTYTVFATNATTTCTNTMTGNTIISVNPVPTTPGVTPSANPACAGSPVTFTATGGSTYEFFVNAVSQGTPSHTSTFTTSSLTNGQNVTVASYNSIIFDGNITEPLWGSPLATSAGGPTPGFGAGHELNALYAQGDANNINLGIAGNVQAGNRILLFIDSKTGGYNNMAFGRSGAPQGVDDINSASTFDAGFNPDYCLVIGENGSSDNYFDLYTLSGSTGTGGGPNTYLGTRTIYNAGAVMNGNPANSSQTRGFEVSLPKTLLGYTSGNLQLMAMYTSEAGFLSNQFLTRADVSSTNYSGIPITFSAALPDPVTVLSGSLNNTCSATSSPVSMTITPTVTPSVSIAALPAGAICAGTSVTFTATPTNGGTTPAYQWSKNGTNVGINSATYTDNTLANNDAIACVLTSNATCASPLTGTSNTITMTVNANPTAPVSGGDIGVCAESMPGTISATRAGSVIDWYDAATAGNLLSSASNTYTTSTPNTYYAEARTVATGCVSTSRTAVALSQNPAPVAYNVTGGACVPAAMGLSNSQVGVNYQLKRNGTINVGSPIAGTGASFSFGTQSTAGIYSVVGTDATTGCTATMTGVSTVNICDVTWAGTTSTDWFDQTNWNPQAVPNLCAANVIIPVTTLQPVISSASVTVGNVNIAAGAILTLSGQNLNVCGTWTGGSGTNAAVVGSGTVYLNSSSGAQSIIGNTQFDILQITNSNGVALASGAAISISKGLHLQTGNLNVTAGTLRLLSANATSNSYIDDFTSGFGGSITGSIIADRYVPVVGYNQHFLSSPVNSPGLSQVNATGPDGQYILPTGNCDETKSGLHTPYGSCFVYNDGYRPNGYCMLGNWMIKSVGNMENGKGYSVYLTGNSTLSLTGEANTGPIAISGLNNSGYDSVQTLQGQWIESGWNLVGNPYPSAIDMTQTRVPDGFQNQVQLWVTSGPFSGSWQAQVIDNIPGHVIVAPFQAFMVRTTHGSTGNHTYQFRQNERIRNTNVPFYRTNSESTLKLELDYNGVKDITKIAFNPSGTFNFDDEYDANKYNGGAGRPTLYTTTTTNTWFAINTLPSLKQVTTVPMGLRPEANGTMSITAQGIETFDPTTYIYLEDKLTGKWHNLRDGAYTFATTKTDAQSRFVVHFTPPASILTTDASCEQAGMITIEQPGSANWNYNLNDASNNIVASGNLNNSAPVTVNANAGTYTLTLIDNAGYTVTKAIQVSGSQPVIADFAASVTSTQVQESITFSSNTTGGTTYTWNFGDGTSASGAVTDHVYQTEGVYIVSLTVTGESGCTASTTRTITITSRNITGVDDLAANTLKIWSHDNMVYIDFSKRGKVEAEIELYDVIGQLLSREKFGGSAMYTKEVPNTEAAYIIVKVKNDDKVTTRKLFITNIK